MNEFILDKYTYNPATGAIVNKKRGYCSTRPDKDGYLPLNIRGKHFYQHRVAWFIMTGTWPDSIDHINGVKHDNRAVNLRSVSHDTNMRNQKKHNTNTSGHTGVSWEKRSGKWLAYIYHDKKRHHLGYFLKLDDAVSARKMAEHKFGFHENHGR